MRDTTQPETRTIACQLELLGKYDEKDFCLEDIGSIMGEIEDVASNIEYYLEHIENMLLPYADRVPTIEEIKTNIGYIKAIL